MLDDAAFGAATEVTPKFISPADPAARRTGAQGGQAFFAYSANYLIDVDNTVASPSTLPDSLVDLLLSFLALACRTRDVLAHSAGMRAHERPTRHRAWRTASGSKA